MKSFPKVSVVTPTLNSQRTLELCLKSIIDQDYPGEVEIVLADGGSTDDTLKIAKSYGARIIKNKLETGEAGKAVGVKYAKGEIIAFIDSDNILPTKRWFSKMVEPFLESNKVVATEPLFFTYRKKDHWLTRYFALLGMGDPLTLFIGNYDRYSHISNKWTNLEIKTGKRRGYFVLYLSEEIPTIGANGFLIRKDELKKYPIRDYLFDIDVLKFLAKRRPIRVAKVNVGIVHLFSGTIATFLRKQRRRIRDYIFFQKTGVRAGELNKLRIFWGIVKFTASTITLLPLLIQLGMGYSREKDVAWLFHPLACWLTLVAYGYEGLRALFIKEPFDRRRWRQ